MRKYTTQARQTLKNAETLSLQTGKIVESVHLLVGIIQVKNSFGAEILERLGFKSEIAETYLMKTSFFTAGSSVNVSPTVEKIIEYADTVAKDTNSDIDTQHLLLAITFCKTCTASKILLKYDVSFDRVLSVVESIGYNRIRKGKIFFCNDLETDVKKQSTDQTNLFVAHNTDSAEKSPLDKYGTDLTKKAKEGKLDKVIAREKEIERIIRILSRKHKNNPIIVGESGVGKTAVAEGLAQKIAFGEVPDFLKNKKLISLNLNSVVAGTKYRGEMEEKLDGILKAAENEGVILFIDELHSVITAGNSENGGSVGSILKPAITGGNIMVIGATTYAEYSKYIEKDPAFERRFNKVTIDEPDEKTTMEILFGIKDDFEKHYSVKITDEALEYAVKLTARYIRDRFLPDKAIDVLDEACSKTFLSGVKKTVSEFDICEAITDMTGIPVQTTVSEQEKITLLEQKLNDRIFGQESAIKEISQAIKRSKAGLRDGRKPIASFLFLGTTGSGKTETAKTLAEIMFGSKDEMLRFDMSEYMEKNSVNRLIGAPPGYVGYDEGGTLTEGVKKKPYSIILFDEIEKADGDIFNVLLQVLDDGRLTDGKGRTVDFRNTIIIMTSNIGSSEIKPKNSIGFVAGREAINEKEIHVKALKKTLKPEFINRIDHIIVFNRLDKEDLSKIANYILERKREILWTERKIKLVVEEEVASFIATKAYDENYGARPVERTVETFLENKLSELILSENLKNTTLTVSVNNDELSVVETP